MANILVCICILFPHLAIATFKRTNAPQDDFFIPGDLNIGIILGFSWSDKALCDSPWSSLRQAAQAAKFRLREVNKDTSILPNISLGTVFLNTCADSKISLYQATQILPPESCISNFCKRPSENATNPTIRPCYNVVAAVLTTFSSGCVPVSQLLSAFKIPHISWGATSDTLSDKKRFPYFLRLVPPNQFQARAIIDLLLAFNWTYVSMLGIGNEYGRTGMSALRVLARENGICIAYSSEIQLEFKKEDYEHIIRMLRTNVKARAVILFTTITKSFFKTLYRMGIYEEFIFILSDGNSLENYSLAKLNSFVIQHAIRGKIHDQFERFYEGLSPDNYLESPGFYERPKLYDSCNMTLPKTINGSCFSYERMDQLPDYRMYHTYRYMIDAMNVIILSIDSLIRENCPSAFLNKSLLSNCIDGPKLLKIMQNTSFTGYSGQIHFDRHGNGMRNYEFKQLQTDGKGGYKTTVVGEWDVVKESLTLYKEKIKWYSSEKVSHLYMGSVPESVCAKPCLPGQFYIQGELKCCWECRNCRTNERVRSDNRGCVTCQPLYWPNQDNFTTCIPIPPTYMDWLDPLALGLLGLAGAGLLITICITYIFIKYKEKKVVKGSSVEQMVTIILALFMSYANTVLLIAKPTFIICQVQYHSYHLSCTLTFVPLLLKTTRLYRIFAAAERCQQEIKYVSSRALQAFSLMLIAFEVCI